MFGSFVIGKEMSSPRCKAESLKLFLSNVVASVDNGRIKAVSSV